MTSHARSAAALPAWILVGAAGLAGTLSFTVVHASRTGCVGATAADLVAVSGIGGLGLALAALVLVGAVPPYRRLPLAAGGVASLFLSIYAVVAFLARDSGACPF